MSEQRKPHGPYESSAEAFADAAELRDAIDAADPGFGPMTDQVRAARLKARVDYLTAALTVAGVELGEYDARIARWLATWDAETLQVLVGWIERAHDTGPSTTDKGARAAESATAPEPEITHHATMRHGTAGTECGTRRLREPMTRAWKDVTCPACLATLDDENGGAPCA